MAVSAKKERDDMNQQEKEIRWAASIQAAGIIGSNMAMFGFYPQETVRVDPDDPMDPSEEDVAQRVANLAR